MRTTVDLPDEVFRQAKAQAALQGMTFKDLIARFVRQGLRSGFQQEQKTERRRRRSEPPIARAATGRPLPVFSSAELHRILDEE
jgi:hypothetical protein